MARVSLLGTDYSEDKRAIAGRVFTKDQIPRELKRQGGGKRRGLGPRNDVLTTCKAITLRDGQRIIAAFFHSKYF